MRQILSQLKKTIAFLLSFTLVITTSPAISQTTEPQPASGSMSSYSGQGAPMSTEELDALVSPIALYPDQLVAQILSAATFPDQVAVADNWLQQNKSLTGSALMQAVDKESWDPSVKALTQFPTVLHKMAESRLSSSTRTV
jgi:hypothetical protein